MLFNKKNKYLTKRSKLLQRKQTIAAYLFLLPTLVFFATFVVVPMIIALVTSFFNYSSVKFDFVGIFNYIKAFNDPIFHIALKNTIMIVVVAVPTVMGFSLWVASRVYKMTEIPQAFYRIVFYLPVVTGSVAVTVVWRWMFNKYNGLVNSLLTNFGIIEKGISWFGSEETAIWIIIMILFTTSIGQPIVLYISALNNVDKSVLEASDVDGANEMQKFWQIKWPLIMPTTLYVVIITTINSFQIFALIQLLTSGGPNNSTQTIMYYIYYNVFKLDNFGFGNTMGIILVVIIGFISAIQFKLSNRKG